MRRFVSTDDPLVPKENASPEKERKRQSNLKCERVTGVPINSVGKQTQELDDATITLTHSILASAFSLSTFSTNQSVGHVISPAVAVVPIGSQSDKLDRHQKRKRDVRVSESRFKRGGKRVLHAVLARNRPSTAISDTSPKSEPSVTKPASGGFSSIIKPRSDLWDTLDKRSLRSDTVDPEYAMTSPKRKNKVKAAREPVKQDRISLKSFDVDVDGDKKVVPQSDRAISPKVAGTSAGFENLQEVGLRQGGADPLVVLPALSPPKLVTAETGQHLPQSETTTPVPAIHTSDIGKGKAKTPSPVIAFALGATLKTFVRRLFPHSASSKASHCSDNATRKSARFADIVGLDAETHKVLRRVEAVSRADDPLCSAP
ncbi:hypothetical protein ACOMHN_041250 [Nucella lapillus]